jgi:hypothetical protein
MSKGEKWGKRRERERRLTWITLTCGSHADSAATYDKTRVETAEGPFMTGFD